MKLLNISGKHCVPESGSRVPQKKVKLAVDEDAAAAADFDDEETEEKSLINLYEIL